MTHINPRNALTGMSAVLLTASALGCTSNRINLAREGIVKFAVADCHPVMISAVAEQDGDETIISGTITRQPPLSPGNLHMDVTITTPGGEVVAARTAMAYPRSVVYRGNRARRFAIWFPFVPPRGSTIHLVCDSKTHPPDEFLPATGGPKSQD
jgi:hypothetical protein